MKLWIEIYINKFDETHSVIILLLLTLIQQHGWYFRAKNSLNITKYWKGDKNYYTLSIYHKFKADDWFKSVAHNSKKKFLFY